MRSFRKQRVANVVRQVVADALTNRLSDPRIAMLTSVTRVEMSADLQVARVFLSVHGGNAVERRTMLGVRHAAGFLQRLVGDHLTLRHCPQLRFEIDESVRIAAKTLSLIEQNSKQKRSREQDLAVDPNEEPNAEASDEASGGLSA